MAGKGSKQWLQEIINFYKINRNGYPYELIYKLTSLLNVLEDTYSVSTVAELQEAIDNIGTDGGTIFIASGTYTVDAMIDIDNCGSLVIYGHGDNTILEAAAGVTIFNITCCQSCIIKTLKLDINNYNLLSPNTQAVIVNETNNNVVIFQDVTIDGDGSNGIGIELQSNNCYVDQCNIIDCKKGVYINSSDRHTISNNIITGHADYGIHVDSANYLTITANTCGSNGDYGIYLDTVTYTTVSSNICNSNTKTGIYCDSSNNNTITSNSCSSNSENGIYITNCNYNTISGNTLGSNDSSSAAATAGLYITSNSDYNTITGNTVNNNNNAGLGTGYGIYIATATCDENVVASNNANGNDVDYMDSGTATTVEYYVQNTDELQDAIDSIGSKAGIINIDASFTVATTIDIDGNGSYIIQGEGDNSTLTIVGDITCINITSARSVLLQNFKIDASSLTTPTKEIIDITEASNNRITIDNIQIIGDGTNGYGIEVNSRYVKIENCVITSVNQGIRILQYYNNVINNLCDSNNTYGIYAYGAYILIDNNNCFNNGQSGIYSTGNQYSSITNNAILQNNSNDANVHGGIHLSTHTKNCIISGNRLVGNVNAGAGTTYGIYIDNITCNYNHISNNEFSANDNTIKDIGINNYIEYICISVAEIQDAIDSIAAKTGTIEIVSGNITVSTTIDIDGGGAYIIQGQGDNTVLTTSGDITCFNIISAISCILKDFKIDASSLTTPTKEIININEVSDNTIVIDSITIIGDSVNGIGVFSNSKYITVQNCRIGTIGVGIRTDDTSCIIQSNVISTCVGACIEVKADYTIVNDNIITGAGAGFSGIYINGGNYCTIGSNISYSNASVGIGTSGSSGTSIVGNSCYNNGTYGIWLGGNNNTVTGNNCYNNKTGIGTNSDFCTITGNLSNNNSENGIYITAGNYNTISGNICESNDSNTVNPQAGIFITTTSDYNNISGNSFINNNNAGAGIGYGIYIADNSCVNNIIQSNNIDGNDVQWKDVGTSSDFEYRCSTNAEIQDAIDSIGAKSGTIQLVVGTGITINTTIDIDGGGSYTITGEGDNYPLNADDGITIFNITNATSCLIENVAFSGWNYTVATTPLIIVNEGSDDRVILRNLFIYGHNVNKNGYGIVCNSRYVVIEGCNIIRVNRGIRALNDNIVIVNGWASSCVEYGIEINGGDYCLIDNNICNVNGQCGIYTTSTNYSNIINNQINENDSNSVNSFGGIHLGANTDKCIIENNSCLNNNNAGAGTTYGIFIDNANCDDNIIKTNILSGNDIDYLDSGTGTILFGDDTVYGAGWNGDLGTATRNAIYDKIQLVIAAYQTYADAKVSDVVYGVGWNGVTTIAPSKNAVYDKIELVIAAGGAPNAFATITGITNDVVADNNADTLTLTSANNLLSIVGTAATDTITYTINEANFVLDGITAQIDGINSDLGAFPFTTAGTVTFNQAVIVQGLLTADGLVPEGDLVDSLGTAALTWLDLFVQDIKDAAGNVILSNDGAGNIDALANLSCNIVFTGAQTVDGVDISAIVSFKTITGITNDVVADSLTDTLTFVAGAGLTIVGTAATDTITFTNTITQYTDVLAVAAVEAAGLTMGANIAMGAHDITLGAGQLVDGKDVSGLCTTAEAHAYVEANALTMTQDITFNAGQLFDGEDVSALATDLALQCTTAEAIAALLAQASVIPRGSWNFDTDTGNKKFNISRLGNLTENLSIWVDDINVYFDYAQDEVAAEAHSYIFDITSGASGDFAYVFKINTVAHFTISDNGLDATVPLDMGGQAITNVGNVDGVDVSSIVAFKTITGITNDVVADSLTDTLTFAAVGGLTIVGTAATDTITFTNTITQYTDAMADARIVVQNTHPAGTTDIVIDTLIEAHKDLANAHHTPPVAGDFAHNSLAGIDAGDIQHMTVAEMGALHNIYVDASAVQAVEDAGLVLSEDKTISFNADPADTKFAGNAIDIDTTGCNIYDLVYVDGNNSVAPADASDDTKMPAIGIVIAAGKVLTHGTVKDDDLIVCTTGGAVVYASTVLRKVTETAPNGVGNMIQVVGVCTEDHTLFVNVSLDMVKFKA